MEQFELNAEPRGNSGKRASRRLRTGGMVPGIVYGTEAEARPIAVKQDDLLNQLKREAFFSHILTLTVGGKSEKVVLKDLQRHPYKPVIMHIDFQRISETEELTMHVPIHFLNEETCIGVKQAGGVISHIMTELEISCLPKDLPEFIEVDLAEMNLGQSIHVGEITLPPGVKIHGEDPGRPVVSVHVPREIEIEEEVAEAVVEPGAVPVAEAVPAPEAATEAAGDKEKPGGKEKPAQKEKAAQKEKPGKREKE